ncbi:hypothetical protein [Thermaurantimonas sp.]|uniref:hypothetical protein n=1 Tax=Thermaurantimonas sp. TaxID=2681568 RepID=UPI00391A48C8
MTKTPVDPGTMVDTPTNSNVKTLEVFHLKFGDTVKSLNSVGVGGISVSFSFLQLIKVNDIKPNTKKTFLMIFVFSRHKNYYAKNKNADIQ